VSLYRIYNIYDSSVCEEERLVEYKPNGKYCSRCYQYDPKAESWPNGCRVCLGYGDLESETSFAAAFLMMDDEVGETDSIRPACTTH
jgi:hypothetical protein